VLVEDTTQKPFDDPKVRTAFKLAADRTAVLNTVFAGFGAVTGDLMMAPTDAYYPDGLAVPAHDPEQAKSLLAAAGHRDGIDMEVRVLFGARDERPC
jgi:peptide/nickel transport system substrate-binding protein